MRQMRLGGRQPLCCHCLATRCQPCSHQHHTTESSLHLQHQLSKLQNSLIIILSSHMSLCTAFCPAPCTALSPANDSRRATGGLKATLQLVLKSSHEQPSNLPDHFLIPPANWYWSSPELCVSDRVTCCFPPVCWYNYHPHCYRCSEPLAMTS